MRMEYPKEIQEALIAYDNKIEDLEIITPLIIAAQAGNRPPQYITESRSGSKSWSRSGSGSRPRSWSRSRSGPWLWSGSWSRSGVIG